MTLKEEMNQAVQMEKTFITPYKLNELQKTASKIANILMCGSSAVTYGYEDMKVIMRIVDSMLNEHLQETNA